MSVVIDERAFEALVTGPEVRGYLLDVGDQVAEAAAQRAPKRTGAGAASIHAELADVDGQPECRVSWDEDHFYLAFHELGTEDQPARPFLRTALAEVLGG